MKITHRYGERRFDRRTALRAVGIAAVPLLSGCLGSDATDDGDERERTDDEPGDDSGEDERSESVGSVEIAFLGETYAFDDASCEGSATYPPENERIEYRNPDEPLEFWVERHDPSDSDVVEVQFSFPTGAHDETIGEVEAYAARTTIDEIEFELGSGTAGTLHLEPSDHMNDDVEHDPDGGEIAWEIAC